MASMSMYERYLVSTKPYYQPPLNPLQRTAIAALQLAAMPRLQDQAQQIPSSDDENYEDKEEVGVTSPPKTPKSHSSSPSSSSPENADQETPVTPFSLRSLLTPTHNYVRRNEFLEELELGETPCPGEWKWKCGSGARKRDLKAMSADLGGRCGLEGRFVRRRLVWN